MKTARAFASLAIVGITGSTAWADSTLSLTTTHGDDPLHAGDLLEVTLSMSGLGEHEVAGDQFVIAAWYQGALVTVDGDDSHGRVAEFIG